MRIAVEAVLVFAAFFSGYAFRGAVHRALEASHSALRKDAFKAMATLASVRNQVSADARLDVEKAILKLKAWF